MYFLLPDIGCFERLAHVKLRFRKKANLNLLFFYNVKLPFLVTYCQVLAVSGSVIRPN